MGYIYATIAMFAFTVLGLTYKFCDKLECDKRYVNLFFYLTAGVISLFWAVAGMHVPDRAALTVGLGGAMGLVCFFAILMFREAIAKGPIAISWTVLNLSLIIPIILSIFLWNEIPPLRHCAGLLLTVAAIVLLGIDTGKTKR